MLSARSAEQLHDAETALRQTGAVIPVDSLEQPHAPLDRRPY
jgi:hypothetical protein